MPFDAETHAEIQRLRNWSIPEGESILKSGRSVTGRRMNAHELNCVRRAVETSKHKLAALEAGLVLHTHDHEGRALPYAMTTDEASQLGIKLY
jgi:hypothetical protein